MLHLNKIKRARYYIFFFLLPALLVYTVFMIMPLFNSMRMSFYTGQGIVPDQFCGFQNYIRLFTQFPFQDRIFNAFSNNVKFFLMVSIFQNVTGFFLAVLVTRKIRGTRFFRTFYFLPTALSVIVVGFLFKLMLNPVWGIFDKMLRGVGLDFIIRPWLGGSATALPVLAAVTAWHMIGIPLVFFTAGIDGIPEDIIEASRIDGINIWGEIRHIIFPLLKPIIGIVVILTFVGNFSEFEIVYAMESVQGDPAFATDIFGSFFYRTTFGTMMNVVSDVGLGAAIATIMFILILTGVIFFLRLSWRER